MTKEANSFECYLCKIEEREGTIYTGMPPAFDHASKLPVCEEHADEPTSERIVAAPPAPQEVLRAVRAFNPTFIIDLIQSLQVAAENPTQLSDKALGTLLDFWEAGDLMVEILLEEAGRRLQLSEAQNGSNCKRCGLKISDAEKHDCVKRLAKRLARHDLRYDLPEWLRQLEDEKTNNTKGKNL